jgi:hypothetical protein
MSSLRQADAVLHRIPDARRVMDAEDVVQDAFLRWQQAAETEVRVPHAWLTTVATAGFGLEEPVDTSAAGLGARTACAAGLPGRGWWLR